MSKTYAYLLVFSVMVIWGLNVVMLKVLVEQFAPITMTSFRIVTAGVVVALVLSLQKKWRKLTKMEWKYTMMATILGVVGHHFFLAFGLTQTTASNTALILALIPLTTSVFATLLLQDRLSKLRITGIGFALTGVSMVILWNGGAVVQINRGDVSIFIAMLVQSLSFIYIKKATDTLDARQMTGVMLLIGSALLFVISFFIEPNGLSQMNAGTGFVWGVFFFSAIAATAVGHMLYNSAIHRLGAGQTAVFNNFVPFFGLVSSALFLDERIAWTQLIGFLLIVAGVLLGTGYVDEKISKVHMNQKAS